MSYQFAHFSYPTYQENKIRKLTKLFETAPYYSSKSSICLIIKSLKKSLIISCLHARSDGSDNERKFSFHYSLTLPKYIIWRCDYNYEEAVFFVCYIIPFLNFGIDNKLFALIYNSRNTSKFC